MKPAIAYCRVSDVKQGRSGLGLEAQQHAINRFCEAEMFSVQSEFIEVETGKGFDALDRRPQLAAALKAAKKASGTILVAKLDRLSRNVAFIATVMEKRVPFIVCNLGPNVDPFMLHIYAAIAEKERNDIAQRTREALAAAKRKGKVLGNAQLAIDNAQAAIDFAETLRSEVWPVINLSSHRIAKYLNSRGVKTQTGHCWHSTSVLRLIDRLKGNHAQESQESVVCGQD